jgi:prevent-host-death family protein
MNTCQILNGSVHLLCTVPKWASMAIPTEKKAAALGLTPQTVGKTQARKEFFPLVDSLCSANAAVEITDHGEPVAVLLSYQNYVALTAKAYARAGSLKRQSPNLIGSVVINSALDSASEKIAGMVRVSLDESAGKL